MADMQTGDISRRIGIPVTEELLRSLGFEPTGTNKRARLWDQADYPEMCAKLGEHVAGKADVPMQPRPEGKPKKPAAAGKTAAPKQVAIDLDDEEL